MQQASNQTKYEKIEQKRKLQHDQFNKDHTVNLRYIRERMYERLHYQPENLIIQFRFQFCFIMKYHTFG